MGAPADYGGTVASASELRGRNGEQPQEGGGSGGWFVPPGSTGNKVAAWGGVGQPEAVLTGMVVCGLDEGRGTVGSADDAPGLGRDGPELIAADGGELLSAADDWGATGATSLGDGSGLGDGERDGDADWAGEADGLADGLELARVASTGFAVSGLPREVSTITTSTTPTMTATPTAPVTAIADRKLMSSIRLFNASRSRRSPLTTQHDTANSGHYDRCVVINEVSQAYVQHGGARGSDGEHQVIAGLQADRDHRARHAVTGNRHCALGPVAVRADQPQLVSGGGGQVRRGEHEGVHVV